MRMWTGKGAFQWESSRKWDLNAGSEFCRGDGAVLVPAGLQSFSVFFRRASQSAGTFTLRLHTAPVYMQLLDSEMTGTGARVYGARLDPNQAMGTILFWEVANSGSPGMLVGDIYLVPNHMGSITLPKFSRTVGDSDQGDCVHARVR
jgi:hypothetical protein